MDNGISVHKKFTFKKSSDTGIMLANKSDAEKLAQHLAHSHPEHKVEAVGTRTPTINVVGLAKDYEHEDLLTMVKQQNPGIRSLFEDTNTSAEDRYIEPVYVAPLKKNKDIFRAVIRVSNVIRSVISKQGDRLFVGSQSTCKVYDSIYATRCYKCQEFGHHSKNCNKNAACGYCAGDHETKDCDVNGAPDAVKCVNCVRANHKSANHEANCLTCPEYLSAQHKIKKSIPFFQGKK